jgi:hypothetical protein
MGMTPEMGDSFARKIEQEREPPDFETDVAYAIFTSVTLASIIRSSSKCAIVTYCL